MTRCKPLVATAVAPFMPPRNAVAASSSSMGGIGRLPWGTMRAMATVRRPEYTDKTRTVSRLDFGKFLHGNEREQKELCRKLVDAFRNEGFVKLRNHGVSNERVSGVFEWNKRFFNLPLDLKNKAAHPEQPNPHRGYSYVGQEILSRVKDFEKGDRNAPVVHDIKESYDQGPVEDAMYPNRWPDNADLPGFRSFMEGFYDDCHNAHRNVLRAIAMGFGLKPDFFYELCNVNTSELRLNHYPACAASQIHAGAMRISEHTDFGTVTLLFQDSMGGLEIEDQKKRGSYFPVAPQDRYEMIINIGDCLQRWTNNTLRSTSHRVALPPLAGDWIDSRYSVAYFGKPNRDQHVGPLAEFVRDGDTPAYDNLSAWEYNQQKLNLTY